MARAHSKSPVPLAGGNRAGNDRSCGPITSDLTPEDIRSQHVTRLIVALDGRTVSVKGREAWALAALHEAGKAGLTTLENPAPRWSHYIFKLRGRGLAIETIHEGHGGPYSGHHARYVLRSQLTILEVELAGRAAA